ncbi:MAG TPA: MFS transporter [Pirellulales bacterium]|nr:MFS transporter [Pirellulales bacterium]
MTTDSSDSISSDDAPAASRPTAVRWCVLLCLSTLALLLYVDRVCISQAEQSMRGDLGLTKGQMSWVFNAFALAYCLFEVPTGHWGDRFGSRGVIARVVIWWSAFTALTGATVGLYSLVVVRFLFGAGEAGAFPNVALVITKWFPLREQGKARGIVTTVSLLGGAAAPIMAGYLIGWIGWRSTFAVFGAVGVVWSAAFYWWFRDSPAEHPRCNAAEAELIAFGNAAKPEHATDESIPWKIVLTSPNMWFLGAIMMSSATLFYTQFQWFPTYLKEARSESLHSAGWLTGAMMIGGATGCLLGGLLVDALVKFTTHRKASRRLVGSGSLLLAALSMLAVPHAESAWVATLCNASASFFAMLSVPTWWTVVAEISGKHGAAMWGLMNSMGGLGVIATTSLVGWFVDSRERLGAAPLDCWNPVFEGVGLLLVTGAIFWLWVDPTRSIVEHPPHQPSGTRIDST